MAQFKDYLIAIKTGDLSHAHTSGATPNVTLRGLFGECSPYLLTNGSAIALNQDIKDGGKTIVPATQIHEKWRRNSWDIFRIRTFNVGGIMALKVEKQGTDAWHLEKVVVIPFKPDGSYNLSKRRTFSPRRWFDAADFDKLTSLWIHPDESADSESEHSLKWSAPETVKTAKTKIMRYDNVYGDSTIETNFTYSYSILKGVVIEKEKTKELSTENSIEASISFEAGAGFLGGKTSAEVSTSFALAVAHSCTDRFGTTSTTTEEQTQEIPVTIPAHGGLTIIFQIYQKTLNYKATYDDYEVPITVHDGTVDTSFKVFNKILDYEESQTEARNLAKEAGAFMEL